MQSKFIKKDIKKEINVKSIYTIHYQELLKNYLSKSEKHDFWEIIYADKEDIVVSIDNEENVVKQGEIIFIRPNAEHFVISGDKEPNIFIITFECRSRAMEYFYKKKISVIKGEKYLLQEIMKEAESTFIIPEFDPYLVELKFKDERQIGGLLSIANLLELLLIKIMRQGEVQKTAYRFLFSASGEESGLKDEILKYLSDNVYGTFSLEDLCNKMHYKKAWLCSYFLKATGTHIYQTYIKMKTEEAQKLIRQGYSFAEITDKLCFDNTAYFSQSFKKNVGMTPSEYRKSIF